MSASILGYIYLFLFLACFVFALIFKARLSKHEGDFPETLMKAFVLFLYLGGIIGLFISFPFFISQAREITQSIDLSSNIASLIDNFLYLLELK